MLRTGAENIPVLPPKLDPVESESLARLLNFTTVIQR
jgi:hypothetical protein